jgi:hypothetical protein
MVVGPLLLHSITATTTTTAFIGQSVAATATRGGSAFLPNPKPNQSS